ncbi:DUF3800 domain-containing protein [Candidatus Woesearchaeota archaeon]|nr:DUF3800 domain-containing protein [Candidatus Woesearchaeota archaeon]
MTKEVYIFIDESGDLGKHGSRYFVIAALCITDPKILYNLIKRIRQRKLKKKIKGLSEIKANNSDDEIRNIILNKLANAECEFHIIVVDKSQVKDYLFDKKDKLYNYIAGILVEHAQVGYDYIKLVIDKKYRSSLLRTDFDDYVKNFKVKWNAKLSIEHLESNENLGLQAVDFVAWAVHRKYNTSDDKFYKIIEKRIKSLLHLWK